MLALLVATLAGAACTPSPQVIADAGDPLKALRSHAPTTRYREEFWAEQSHKKTPAWREALAFCRDEGRDEARYPNCASVRIVTFWDTPPPFPQPPSYHFGDVQGVREWERKLPSEGRGSARPDAATGSAPGAHTKVHAGTERSHDAAQPTEPRP